RRRRRRGGRCVGDRRDLFLARRLGLARAARRDVHGEWPLAPPGLDERLVAGDGLLYLPRTRLLLLAALGRLVVGVGRVGHGRSEVDLRRLDRLAHGLDERCRRLDRRAEGLADLARDGAREVPERERADALGREEHAARAVQGVVELEDADAGLL